MSRVLNYVLGFGLLGAVLMALVTPYVLGVLFRPPVSFGTNCEPAATWSMQKLHTAEAGGLVVGMLGGLMLAFYRGRKAKLAEPAPGSAADPDGKKRDPAHA